MSLLGWTSSERVAAPDAIAALLLSGGIRSVYQPIVELSSGDVVAYEALARGPAGPMQSPDVLFAAARAEGLLSELDEACRAAAVQGAIDRTLLAPLTIFVNVEPEILDEAPLTELLSIAKRTPGELRIMLEITERALAARPAELLRTIGRVRALGWGIALDDVGAEPASLAFMSLLRPDVVKLDMSLIQDQPTRQIAEVMNAVNSYAELGGALILAEGIETEAHLDTAAALGATLAQGWYFGRPTAEPVPQLGSMGLLLPPARPTGTKHAGEPESEAVSPFDCLPAGTVPRRARKRLLIELSKHLEREAMRLGESCVVASCFQYHHHFTPATALRYRDLVERTGFVAALGAGLTVEPVPGLRGASLADDDPIIGEWDVVVLSPHFSAALLARDLGDTGPEMERRYEYTLTYQRATVIAAAHQLLLRVTPHP